MWYLYRIFCMRSLRNSNRFSKFTTRTELSWVKILISLHCWLRIVMSSSTDRGGIIFFLRIASRSSFEYWTLYWARRQMTYSVIEESRLPAMPGISIKKEEIPFGSSMDVQPSGPLQTFRTWTGAMLGSMFSWARAQSRSALLSDWSRAFTICIAVSSSCSRGFSMSMEPRAFHCSRNIFVALGRILYRSPWNLQAFLPRS